jgi:hypothetical protein
LVECARCFADLLGIAALVEDGISVLRAELVCRLRILHRVLEAEGVTLQFALRRIALLRALILLGVLSTEEQRTGSSKPVSTVTSSREITVAAVVSLLLTFSASATEREQRSDSRISEVSQH